MPIRQFKTRGLSRTFNTYFGELPSEFVDATDDLFQGDDNSGDHTSPTPYSYNYRRLDHARGTLIGHYHATGTIPVESTTTQEGVLFPIGPRGSPLGLDISDVDREAIAQLISALKAGDFSGAQALGEMDETSRFGGQLLSSTKDLFRTTEGLLDRAAKLGPGRQLRRLSRLAADLWLGYTYAMKPLMNDFVTGYKQFVKDPVIRRKFNVRVSRRYATSHAGNVGPYKCFVTSKEQVVIKYYGSYVVDNPWFDEAASAGLLSPVTLAWELIPLSFVVDWFTGIGDYIGNNAAAIDLNSNGSFESAARSQLVLVSDEYVANDSTDSLGTPYLLEYKWRAAQQSASFSRTRLTAVPYSTFQTWKGLPSFANGRWKQMLSGASLLRSLAVKDEKNLFGHENVRYWSERPPLLPRRTGRVLPPSAWLNLTDPRSGPRD